MSDGVLRTGGAHAAHHRNGEKTMKKVIYYSNDQTDDFAELNIRQKQLPPDYPYFTKDPVRKALAFLLYYGLALPLVFLFQKLIYGERIVGRSKLKPYRKTGYFLYGNHTRIAGDAYTPALVAFPRKAFIVANPDCVSIPGILIASVEMEPDLVEVISEKSEQNTKEKPSKHVEADKTLLMKLAKRLLFEVPDAYQHEKEYYLLLNELKRTAGRLAGIKAYITSKEVELALPLYLTAVKLQQISANTESSDEAAEALTKAEQRLRKAVDKLQSTSLLKLRAQMYLALLAHDEELQTTVQERIDTIKSAPLSIPQRLLLEEFKEITS